MLVNPLFNQDEDENKQPSKKQEDGFVFQHRKGRTIQPVTKGLRASGYTPIAPQISSSSSSGHGKRPAAVNLIRQKVAALYTEEPDIKEELEEAAQPQPPLSPHQQFMQALSTSGKPLAQIQTEWHDYYVSLPDDQKHEVWREFYQANSRQPSAYTAFVAQQAGQGVPDGPPVADDESGVSKSLGAPKAIVGEVGDQLPSLNYEARRKRSNKRAKGPSKLKKQLLDNIGAGKQSQSRAKEHLKSLAFGLGTGAIVLVVFLFSFFNEVIIAPFIQPSRHVSATPIILTSDSVAASDTPEVLIPKINVQIPTVYDASSINEEDIQTALERGVTHYATTALPGQQGNTAFFGHSSNNIFNKGRYKFAFVLLHELVPGDIFYLTYDKKVYTYRVYDKKVVPPSEVSVLNNVPGKAATATLITCDPPGTSTNRLVVWGEQISPDPSGAPVATPPAAATTDQSSPTSLPSEGPTLWGRFWNWLAR